MAELSRVSGVPVATIKYYLREDLLPRGELTEPNQAEYGEQHVRRLRLIRALIEVGGLGVASARKVIRAIESDRPIEETFSLTQRAASVAIDPEAIDASALERIDAATSDWYVDPRNPGRLGAARALAAFERAGQQDMRGWLARYAQAALLLAEADLDEVDARAGREAKAELVVVGTVLGDPLIAGLRRAAQEHISARRYFPETGPDGRTGRRKGDSGPDELDPDCDDARPR